MSTLHPAGEEAADESDDVAPSEGVAASADEEWAEGEEPEEEEGGGREEEPCDEGNEIEEDSDEPHGSDCAKDEEDPSLLLALRELEVLRASSDESVELEESDDVASLEDELSDEELVNELDDPEHVPNAKPGVPRTTPPSSKPQLAEAVTQFSFTVPEARRSMRSILAFGDELDPANGAPTPSSTSSRMTPSASRRRRSSFVLESERDGAG
jgi:hypothetical protein